MKNIDIIRPRLSYTPLPDGVGSETEYLRILVEEGAKNRFGEITPQIRQRIDYELEVIGQNSYPSYFLIWHEIVKAAREELGALVGPGRSSACGSMVNYCLGITAVDPLKHGLLFERFLNPDKPWLVPDIDIDVDEEHREDLLNWIEKRYGSRFSHIASYGKDEDGNLRAGVHVCGFIISDAPVKNVTKLIPVKGRNGETVICTQLDAVGCDRAGLEKFDILGFNWLSLIQKTVQKVCGANANVERFIESIPLDDKATLRLFQKADTAHVPGFHLDGMKEYLVMLHPTKFSDLVAYNAMYRPGPMADIPDFIRKKHNNSRPTKLTFLNETYGMILYQEQMMLMMQQIADFTPGQSDDIRKDMAKRRWEKIEETEHKFKGRGLANGYSSSFLTKQWNRLLDDAPCYFNKSHAVAYTWISYVCAYLETHHHEAYEQVCKA